MRIPINNQKSTLSILAAFLLFLSAEKFASCNFSFISGPFPLQNTSITLIERNQNNQVFDFLTVFAVDYNSFSANDYTGSDLYCSTFTFLKYRYATLAQLILKNATYRNGNSFTQFRLEIKRSNLPSFPA